MEMGFEFKGINQIISNFFYFVFIAISIIFLYNNYV